MTRSNCSESRTSFWTVTFLTYRSACFEFFSQPWLRKKQPSSFRKNELNIFISCCANNLVDSFPYKYMSSLWWLIWSDRVRGSWYLIIWLEITAQSSAIDFWRVPFSNWLQEVIIWNFVFGQWLSRPSWLSNNIKMPVALKPWL